MANDTDSIGFYAGEVLERMAARQPDKTAIIAKEEELSFAELNRRVRALAGHLIGETQLLFLGDDCGFVRLTRRHPLQYFPGIESY